MHCRPPTLLARLRRHRGLWVLVIAVMLIKLASGTFCLADGEKGVARVAEAIATMPVDQPVGLASASDNGCVLGEGTDCHCTCAHSVTLPAMPVLARATPVVRWSPSLTLPSAIPGAPASLLRPPIA